jgi:hypothetical protein
MGNRSNPREEETRTVPETGRPNFLFRVTNFPLFAMMNTGWNSLSFFPSWGEKQ